MISRVIRYICESWLLIKLMLRYFCWTGEQFDLMVELDSLIHHLEAVNVWMKCHGSPPNICWDISVWIKAVDRPSDNTIHYRAMLVNCVCFHPQVTTLWITELHLTPGRRWWRTLSMPGMVSSTARQLATHQGSEKRSYDKLSPATMWFSFNGD